MKEQSQNFWSGVNDFYELTGCPSVIEMQFVYNKNLERKLFMSHGY